MFRDFTYGRGEASELTGTLMIYKNILMSREDFESICRAEDIVAHLMSKARQAMPDLVSIHFKHP